MNRGYYIIEIEIPKRIRIRVGALGEIEFAPGRYAYVGSALGGLEQRVSRHLRGDGKKHWHVDDLLEKGRAVRAHEFEISYESAKTEKIFRKNLTEIIEGNEKGTSLKLYSMKTECILAKAVHSMPGCGVPAHRFGSSDCRCDSHLFYINDCVVDFEKLMKKLTRPE